MTRREAENIVCNHTWAPRTSKVIAERTDSELIYWAIKIRDGIAAARAYKAAA